MPVKQIIEYNSGNDYFAGFLQNIIDQSGINGSVAFQNKKITLLIDNNDEHALNQFNQLVSKYLPHSMFIGEIETLNSDEEIKENHIHPKPYNIAPCAKCLEMLNDPASAFYLDESLKCDHYNNLETLDIQDNTVFSPHYSQGCAVLITDASRINDLFILTEDEAKTLFSIEKPTIKATIKDETLKELTGKNYINLKAAYNNRSALAAINAKESGIEYLFFHDNHDLDVVVVQANKTIIRGDRVASPLEELNENGVINRFLNISKDAGFKNSIGANLSLKNGISFLVSNEMGVKEVIKFQPFSLSALLENFKNDPKRSKLFENFGSKYPNIVEKLQKEQGLFETVSSILELKEEGFEAVSDKSFEFRGNGGLKIDMNFDENGFSYENFIGSVISFKLAGAENHYIAYSIFEAYGDMVITTLTQLKTKFKIDNLVMMGDMFQNSVLYSRILSKFQLNNPYFSKSIALDD